MMRKSAVTLSFRPLLVLGMLLAALSAWALTGPVNAFTGSFDGVDARLNWDLTTETGVQRFELARRVGNDPIFHALNTVSPDGSRYYNYLDQNPHRSADNPSQQSCSYRLTVVTNTAAYEYAITLSQAPSAVQRSWGSIKSMFR